MINRTWWSIINIINLFNFWINGIHIVWVEMLHANFSFHRRLKDTLYYFTFLSWVIFEKIKVFRTQQSKNYVFRNMSSLPIKKLHFKMPNVAENENGWLFVDHRAALIAPNWMKVEKSQFFFLQSCWTHFSMNQ